MWLEYSGGNSISKNGARTRFVEISPAMNSNGWQTLGVRAKRVHEVLNNLWNDPIICIRITPVRSYIPLLQHKRSGNKRSHNVVS